MIIFYGGSQGVVNQQLHCNHIWTGLIVDYISIYAKCTICSAIKRFITDIDNDYYKNILKFCKLNLGYNNKLRHSYLDFPGTGDIYGKYVGVVIPYTDIYLGKEKSLEVMLNNNGIEDITNFGDKYLLTKADCCGESRQYHNFSSIPKDDTLCSCGNTYLLYYGNLENNEYNDILTHNIRLTQNPEIYGDSGGSIMESLGGIPPNQNVSYQSTNKFEVLDNKIKKLGEGVLNVTQTMQSYINKLDENILRLDEKIEQLNTSKIIEEE